MFTNPDCTCTPFIPELCPVCQAEMPPKTRSAPVSRSPVSREHLTRGHLTQEHALYDRIEALKAQNADLLETLELAEPILDAASATAREDGGTMIPGARPAWDAVRAAIERITP